MHALMRAVVVDDEPLARRGICQLLAAHADVEVVAQCANGLEAVAAVMERAPDILFLDVQMPEMDGFEVVRRIGAEAMPAVVFVTAYDEFAVQAFEASAVDYLMKPVGPDRFAVAMHRVNERRSSAIALQRVSELQALLAHVSAQVTPRVARLSVTTLSGVVLINPDEIDWIEADDYYAVIHVRNKRYMLRESLASLEERLPPERFIRVHRSAIVNGDRVRELRRDAVILEGGTRVTVSRRRSGAVASVLRVAPSR